MQIIKKWKDQYGTNQQSIKYSLEDHVSKITISKNTSPNILNLLKRCNFNCDVVMKDK